MKYHFWYNDEFTLGLKVGPKCEAKTTLQKTVLQTLDSHNFFLSYMGVEFVVSTFTSVGIV